MKRGKEEMKDHPHKRAFIWLGLRISFWAMVALYLISLILTAVNPEMFTTAAPFWIALGVIQMLSIFFTFVVSIIHLTRYKKKAFAVVALVFSSIFLLLLLFGFLIGLLAGVASA